MKRSVGRVPGWLALLCLVLSPLLTHGFVSRRHALPLPRSLARRGVGGAVPADDDGGGGGGPGALTVILFSPSWSVCEVPSRRVLYGVTHRGIYSSLAQRIRAVVELPTSPQPKPREQTMPRPAADAAAGADSFPAEVAPPPPLVSYEIVCKSPAVPGGGHLDVFATPGDPYDKDGVIGRLAHGEVIVALDAINFAGQRWVLHARGWSVHVAMGWEWLRRIDDDDDADRQRRSARRCR